jgi:hypothetical protein
LRGDYGDIERRWEDGRYDTVDLGRIRYCRIARTVVEIWCVAVVKEKQQRLLPVKRVIDQERARVRRMASQLHEVYKKYKAGLLTENELSPEMRRLLVKYYGVQVHE